MSKIIDKKRKIREKNTGVTTVLNVQIIYLIIVVLTVMQ